MRRYISCIGLLLGLSCLAAGADERPAVELLLPGGTLYSLAERSYRSLRLPEGWIVIAAAYSPDAQELAFLLVGSGIPPKAKSEIPRTKTKPPVAPAEGPVNQAVRRWPESARLVIVDRRTGSVGRSWRVSVSSSAAVDWTIVWSNAASKPQVAAKAAVPQAVDGECPRTLAETFVQEKKERFVREASSCLTPPVKSDFYRLVRENERTGKDAILWEYRVAADTTTCSEPYACYSGADVQFLTVGENRFLVWDGDLYELLETEDGMRVTLLTQLLPQYSHPLGIASGDTRLSALDIVSKVAYQPVTSALSLPHAENPTLYAQNFCPTRSFSASIEIGPYTKTLLTPAGYQVGPVDIGSFKDRTYTPVLISATWTAFHHIVEPVQCKEPYTIAPHTKGIVVSLIESAGGALQCRIQTQEF